MNEFVNLDRFVRWLDSIHKDAYDLQAVLDDVVRQHDTSGFECYEEGAFLTKSHNPECYHYDVECTCIDEETEMYRTVFIF